MTVLGLNDQPFDVPEEDDRVLKPSSLTEFIIGVRLELTVSRWTCILTDGCIAASMPARDSGNSSISKPSTGFRDTESRMEIRTLVSSGISASTSTKPSIEQQNSGIKQLSNE